MVLQKVIFEMGNMRRAKNLTDKSIYQMITIFVCQYVNTSIIILLAYNSFTQNPNLRLTNNKENIFVGPFDEFDVRWYLVVGTPIVLAIFLHILLPHIGLMMQAMSLFMRRCYDRKLTCRRRITRQIIQSDYEDLYTGPEFLIQVRLAQLLTLIFVTLTYSSGMPLLYLVTGASLFVTYWSDKVLVLRYYRKTIINSPELITSFVSLLPWAIVTHALFGGMIYSYPQLLKSEAMEDFLGNSTQYFNKSRLG